MSSTYFLSKLTDNQIKNILAMSTKTELDEIETFKVDRTNEAFYHITLNTNTILDNEIEEICLSDFYEVSDYDIEAFDYYVDNEERHKMTQRWRSWMYQKFKHAYAIKYLMET